MRIFQTKNIIYILKRANQSASNCNFSFNLFFKFEVLWRDSSANFSAYDLQHNQLSGTKFVSKGNDGSFVMAHRDVEDVHSGGECADLTSVLHFPEADGSVLTTGYDDFVVRGNGNAPNLKKKKEVSLSRIHMTLPQSFSLFFIIQIGNFHGLFRRFC